MNFDASARLACTVKRSRSNTPLQALTLLNDPVYVEAAQALAARVADASSRTPTSTSASITCLPPLRRPRRRAPREQSRFARLFDAQLQALPARSEAARSSSSASVALPDGVAAEELAAWYAVATALLNLDETITKG